ncbi:hypothetical protein LTR53_014785, partial [Teratosphaeriaceae sp. CCFEE 6253]
MDLGRVMEGGEWGAREPASRVAPSHFRAFEDTVQPGTRDPAPPTSSSDEWAGALHRLQAQVALNTNLLESHRRQVGDLEQAVGRLQHDMGGVVAVINDMRAELQARVALMEQARHDAGDLEVLAVQVATVTGKANEIDNLKMQLELLRNRVRRVEDHGSPGARPATSSTHREFHEGTHPQHPLQPPPQVQHLPPMRTGSSFASPADRSHGMMAQPMLPSQGAHHAPHAAV